MLTETYNLDNNNYNCPKNNNSESGSSQKNSSVENAPSQTGQEIYAAWLLKKFWHFSDSRQISDLFDLPTSLAVLKASQDEAEKWIEWDEEARKSEFLTGIARMREILKTCPKIMSVSDAIALLETILVKQLSNTGLGITQKEEAIEVARQLVDVTSDEIELRRLLQKLGDWSSSDANSWKFEVVNPLIKQWRESRKIINHPNFKPFDSGQILEAIDGIVAQNLSDASIGLKLNELADTTGKRIDELRKIYQDRTVELDSASERDELSETLPLLFDLHAKQLDLAKILPQPLAEPLLQVASAIDYFLSDESKRKFQHWQHKLVDKMKSETVGALKTAYPKFESYWALSRDSCRFGN
jgi:DNA primase